MPYIKLDTTVTISPEDKKNLAKLFGELITIIPGKTETYLMTKIEDGNFMTFGGSDEPCAMVEVIQFGAENKEAYNNLTAAICKEIAPVIGVAPDRMYVKYSESTNWGWNGRNF